MSDRIEVLNINIPGSVTRVDAAKYQAMKTAILRVAPSGPPGLTAAQKKAAVLPLLPNDHFPGGKTAGWWLKCVQLDLEARNELERSKTSPLHFWRPQEETRK